MEVKTSRNGTHRYNTRDPFRGSRSKKVNLGDKVEYGGRGGLPNKLKGRYGAERLVGYLILCLLAGAGIELAIRTANDNFFIMFIQICGFVASTVAIMIVKHKMGEGIYIGRQLRYARGFYFMGVIFESLTLLTKYYPDMIEAYLISVAFTGPALLLSMGKIEDLDDDIRIHRMKKEARSTRLTLKSERILLAEIIPEKKQLATMRAEDNIQDRRNGQMIKKSRGISSWFKVRSLASREMKVVYQNIQTKEQKRATDRLKKSVSDARVIGTTSKKRTSRGPRPDTAANGIYCKAKGCDKKLTGKQRSYCSEECGSRERQRRLRERRKS